MRWRGNRSCMPMARTFTISERAAGVTRAAWRRKMGEPAVVFDPRFRFNECVHPEFMQFCVDHAERLHRGFGQISLCFHYGYRNNPVAEFRYAGQTIISIKPEAGVSFTKGVDKDARFPEVVWIACKNIDGLWLGQYAVSALSLWKKVFQCSLISVMDEKIEALGEIQKKVRHHDYRE